MNNKILSLISLATRAGKVVSGEFSVEKAIKEGKAQLAIIAEDASEHTKKKFHNMCTYYKVPLYELATKEELGHFTGKEMRATVAITDIGFANTIKDRFKQ